MRQIVVAMSVFLFVLPAAATNLTVDCTGAPAPFTSITAALNTLDFIGPHTITVLGTCTENVNLVGRNSVTIFGSGSAAIHGLPGGGVSIARSRGITLRNLTISVNAGGGRAVFMRLQSEVTLDGVIAENSGQCIVALDQSVLTAGGKLPINAVTAQGCGTGIALDTSTFTSNGFLTVQNNTIAGIDARASSVALFGMQSGPVPGGINAIVNNGGNGIFAHAGTTADLIGKNSVTGNTLNAALAFQSSTINTTGSAGLETTFANNTRGGVAMIFNSGGRLVHAILQNNGDGNPLASGVTSSQNSAVLFENSTISGTNGPGVLVEAGGFIRMLSDSISGNASDPIVLHTGAIAELGTGNTIDPGNGKNAVVCDASAILFGDGADVPADCKKSK